MIAKSAGERIWDIFVIVFLGLLSIVMFIPFYNMILVSTAPYEDYVRSALYIWPTRFDFTAYKLIFLDKTLVRAVLFTTGMTIVGTTINLLVTTAAAFALSQKKLPDRGIILTLIIISMYFSGGLIPYFLVLKDLGFIDNPLVYVLPTAFDTFWLLLMKNYFNSIPESLQESAEIDGANPFTILTKIIIPVSTPIIATIALFFAVSRWNEWWMNMLFVRKPEYYTLQYLLRKVVIDLTLQLGPAVKEAQRTIKVYPVSIQMATVTVATIPILIIYPFLQKYFTQGIMLGSLKE